MSWARTARQKQLAPVGQFRPETFRVVVHDTFQQFKLHTAAHVIRNGMLVPEFLLFCAAYVIRHHRDLKRFRSIFREGERDILAAAASPVGPEIMEPETERERRRALVFERFARRAEAELHEDITGERR